MKTATEVLRSVGDLEEAMSELNAERGFDGAQARMLSGHRMALESARGRFDMAFPLGTETLARFEAIVGDADAARATAIALPPVDALVDSFGRDVRALIGLLDGASSKPAATTVEAARGG